MINKKIVLCVVLCLIMIQAAFASITTLNFTNDEVDLGHRPQVNITDQYEDFGVTFEDVFRYVDNRDPWRDSEEMGGFGISNGRLEDNFIESTEGKIYFDVITNYVSVDWWTTDKFVGGELVPTEIHIEAWHNSYLIDSFVGIGDGTVTLANRVPRYRNITHLIFHNNGGFVQISNMSFVPEPATILLLGFGIGFIRMKK